MKDGIYAVVWDHKAQPPWNEIFDAVNNISFEQDAVHYVALDQYDTGGDDYGLVISEKPLKKKKARKIFSKYFFGR